MCHLWGAAVQGGVFHKLFSGAFHYGVGPLFFLFKGGLAFKIMLVYIKFSNCSLRVTNRSGKSCGRVLCVIHSLGL